MLYYLDVFLKSSYVVNVRPGTGLVWGHLRHVGDLGGGPVPGVHQHSVIRLVSPARLTSVHLSQPVSGGPGSLIPANDDSSVSPPAAEDISVS